MNKKLIKDGIFIVIDGSDGSGKTTVAKSLVDRLNAFGYDAIYTREPGGTPTAEKLRDIFKNDFSKMSYKEQTMMIMTARSMNLNNVILPALNEGKIVVCDRYMRSTFIYQGYYNNIEDIDFFYNLMNGVTSIRYPDYEAILLVDPDTAYKRSNNRLDDKDDIESGYEFYKRINDAYKEFYIEFDNIYDVNTRTYIDTTNKTVDSVTDSIITLLRFNNNDEVKEYNNHYGY